VALRVRADNYGGIRFIFAKKYRKTLAPIIAREAQHTWKIVVLRADNKGIRAHSVRSNHA